MFSSSKGLPIKRLLVMRFGAMGDAAMTVYVLYALATQHPDLRITMLTRTRFVPMFEWLPANVQVKGVDFAEHDGIVGLTKMFGNLKKGNFDAVADLHNVLRSKYLRTCFAMLGVKVAKVNKGRMEKKQLIGHGVDHEPLKHMTERYAEVFRSLGLSVDLSQKMQLNLLHERCAVLNNLAGEKSLADQWVGVAPFAAHLQKIYPLDRMQQVVSLLADQGCKVFLFGAGRKEAKVLEAWEEEYQERKGGGKVINICGKMEGLRNEMLLMSKLNLMISMDSANMHIASIFGTPVLSIWGATHPKAGFSGYGQSPDSEMQLEELNCRPCSIYGKKPCRFGDLRCMNIAPDKVVEKACEMINQKM